MHLLAAISLPLVPGGDLVKAITIPLFTGAIGYVINWSGVWILFSPDGDGEPEPEGEESGETARFSDPATGSAARAA